MAALVDVSFPVRTSNDVGDACLRRLALARERGDDGAVRACERAVVEQYRALADRIARRYRGRGVEDDDLRQLARFGLFKAIRRWRPAHNPGLVQFATPTIEGEIKRYFRDHCRPIRMPRSLQEDLAAHQQAEQRLGQSLGRAPTVQEIADAAGTTALRVRRQRVATATCQPVSAETTHGSSMFRVRCADSERAIDMVEDIAAMRMAINRLSPREREILRLRFFEDLSQVRIAQRLGISQMHVSRLLRRTLNQLRSDLG